MPRRTGPDERGAIMLIALAFAVFGVALLYYAVGIAQTILLREKLQDAADATALSSAVAHARCMNFLVLLNIIMAALIAVLIAFKLVETLAVIGIIIAAALAWVTGGSTLSAIPPLKVVQQEMRSLYDTSKDPVFSALEVLHDTADAVVAVAPGATRGVAQGDLATFWQPEVQQEGVIHVPETGLPVEDDTFDALCERGGKLAGGLAMKPLPLPGKIKDAVKDALGELTGSMSDWFCGDSGGPPPSAKPRKVNKRYPRSAQMDECQNEQLSADQIQAGLQDPSSFSTVACSKASLDSNAAEPDDQGGCRLGMDCSESGPYETFAQLARQQCDPTTAPTPFDYRYQVQKGEVDYTYDKKLGWVRGEPTLQTPSLMSSSTPACGPRSVRPSIAVGYVAQVRASRGGPVQPLCSDEQAPTLPPLGPQSPTRVTVRFTHVNQVLSCNKRVEEPVKTGDADSSRSDSAKYPKRIRGGVVLGSDAFQARVIVKTRLDGAPAERIVKLALWNAATPSAARPAGEELRPYGFAQAEYFYDGSDASAEWMWNMKWRGRLRRFRLPDQPQERGALFTECLTTFKNASLITGLLQVEAQIAH